MRLTITILTAGCFALVAVAALAQENDSDMVITGIGRFPPGGSVRIEAVDFTTLKTRDCSATTTAADASLPEDRSRFSIRVPQACVGYPRGTIRICWTEGVERCQVMDFEAGKLVDLGELKYVPPFVSQPDVGSGTGSAQGSSPTVWWLAAAAGVALLGALWFVAGVSLLARRR